mgnify:CR=1 FL=1
MNARDTEEFYHALNIWVMHIVSSLYRVSFISIKKVWKIGHQLFFIYKGQGQLHNDNDEKNIHTHT